MGGSLPSGGPGNRNPRLPQHPPNPILCRPPLFEGFLLSRSARRRLTSSGQPEPASVRRGETSPRSPGLGSSRAMAIKKIFPTLPLRLANIGQYPAPFAPNAMARSPRPSPRGAPRPDSSLSDYPSRRKRRAVFRTARPANSADLHPKRREALRARCVPFATGGGPAGSCKGTG